MTEKHYQHVPPEASSLRVNTFKPYVNQDTSRGTGGGWDQPAHSIQHIKYWEKSLTEYSRNQSLGKATKFIVGKKR